MIDIYLAGALVAFGYQLSDDDFRVYDLIDCPLVWPSILILQVCIMALRRRDLRAAAGG